MLRDAQAAFDRVQQMSSPQLAEASACLQSQASMLSVALPAEESEIRYRKGFCQLVVAALTNAPAAFTDAAADLDRSGATMLAWLARRAGHLDAPPEWTKADNCPESCQPLIPVAKLWLGWLALDRGDTAAAESEFDITSGWYEYASGIRGFQEGHYPEAVSRYKDALTIWNRTRHESKPTLSQRLAPSVDIPHVLTELGAAQLLSGDVAGAIGTLDQAAQTSSPSARVYFLRARAKELSGQADAALADYNLASRAAFASAVDLASGEAHLYRGILYYRRKDYARAEDEFSSALNFEISPVLRPDASAWRHLSAVASGSCGASRQYLEQSLPSVSPYFPKDEAKAVAANCLAGTPP